MQNNLVQLKLRERNKDKSITRKRGGSEGRM
jgi:hypothetical protein